MQKLVDPMDLPDGEQMDGGMKKMQEQLFSDPAKYCTVDIQSTPSPLTKHLKYNIRPHTYLGNPLFSYLLT